LDAGKRLGYTWSFIQNDTETAEAVADKIIGSICAVKKINYVTNVRVPTEKAHGKQIARTCEALADLGIAVTLFHSGRKSAIKEDFFGYYDIKENFSLRSLKTLDVMAIGFFPKPVRFYLQKALFLVKIYFRKWDENDHYYTRDPEIAWALGGLHLRVVFEAHSWPSRGARIMCFLLKNTDHITANSSGTAEEFTSRGFRNISVVPNGFTPTDVTENKLELRERFSLPRDAIIFMYIGGFAKWKGVPFMLSAWAKHFGSKSDYHLVLGGGTKEDVDDSEGVRWKDLQNVHFLGRVSYKEQPYYFKAADILILPNSKVTRESVSHTSPIKMFDYMASGRPIVASRLPSIMEVLNEDNSFLYEADDEDDFARKLDLVLEDKKGSDKRASVAKEQSKDFTWSRRASKMVDVLSKICK